MRRWAPARAWRGAGGRRRTAPGFGGCGRPFASASWRAGGAWPKSGSSTTTPSTRRSKKARAAVRFSAASRSTARAPASRSSSAAGDKCETRERDGPGEGAENGAASSDGLDELPGSVEGRRHPPTGGHGPLGAARRVSWNEAMPSADARRAVVRPFQRAAEGFRAEREVGEDDDGVVGEEGLAVPQGLRHDRRVAVDVAQWRLHEARGGRGHKRDERRTVGLAVEDGPEPLAGGGHRLPRAVGGGLAGDGPRPRAVAMHVFLGRALLFPILQELVVGLAALEAAGALGGAQAGGLIFVYQTRGLVERDVIDVLRRPSGADALLDVGRHGFGLPFEGGRRSRRPSVPPRRWRRR